MKLEQKLRETIAEQHKSDATADCYWNWVKQFLLFARERRGTGEWVHPSELNERHVEVWLKHLACDLDVSANTQNQAFSALCYLYRHVLKKPLENVSSLRAKRPDRIREVLHESEIVQLFDQLHGVPLLCARMMYASSFRIGELAKIRIKDISFERCQIVIREGKGKKDRSVPFPKILHEDVQRQIESMRVLWKHDLADGLSGVSLPHAFGKKSPKSHLSFAWWYFLAADDYSRDPKTGKMYRHHRDMGHIARQIKEAAERCGFDKRVTSHCIRHSFGTHSVENGVPIHVVQKIMGHTSIETTMGYLHVSKNGVTSMKTPLESLPTSALKEVLSNPTPRPEPKPTEQPQALRLFVG
jgi:integron integrase